MRTVPALDRGLQILDLLGEDAQPLTASRIGSVLGIPRSATYELLHTLRSRGFLAQHADGSFSLGSRLPALGGVYMQRLDLARTAQVVASQVSHECDETAQVGVLDGRHVLYLARADSTQMVRLVSAVGRRVPAHCTALGKVLLAHLDSSERARRLANVELERLTERSVADFDDLQRQLIQVLVQGCATEDGESNPDVSCVAAPVLDVRGQCIAAISISVPSLRMTTSRKPLLIASVRRGAEELSKRLGYDKALAGGVREQA